MDEDKVFEMEMELLELSFKSAKPPKVKNDWDRWQQYDNDEEWLYEYTRKRKLEELKKEDDLNERR
jgi:hypothetical protein